MSNKLKIGIGISNITPAVGGQLFGYKPDVFSKSVNDSLTATAMAFVSENTRVIFISAAVCVVNTELSDKIRKIVADKTDVAASHVILSAFHTHSAPNTCGYIGWGNIDSDYCENIFIPRIVEAAIEAVQTLRPVLVGVASVWSQAGINRRQYDVDCTITLGQNPREPYDGIMTIVAFKGLDGTPVANLVHYGAHCTSAGINTEITRDWAGVMIDRLAQESGAPVVFLNGAEGDVGPRLSNGGTIGNISYIYETGGIAAVDAVRAYRKIKEYRNVGLSVVTGELVLPLSERIPLKAAKEKLKEYEGESVNLSGRTAQFYRDVIETYENNSSPETSLILSQTIIALGDIVFVPFPFEPFSEISMRMREYSPYTHTLCIGLANGSKGYLPTQTQLCRGGYEVESFKTESVWPLADDTDNHIIEENLKLIGVLKCIE